MILTSQSTRPLRRLLAGHTGAGPLTPDPRARPAIPRHPLYLDGGL